jgi:5-formyltetrahydrofolate cyclo-ligase
VATEDASERKSALRQQVRAITVAEALAVHGSLAAELLRRGATVVAGFIPLPGELDVLPLLRELQEAGITVLVPRIVGPDLQFAELDEQALALGRYGLLEPTASQTRKLNECDAVLIPALACDAGGGRLGRGAGFYDRALARLAANIWRVGVVADERVLPSGEIPMDEHDVRVHAIATQSQLANCLPA